MARIGHLIPSEMLGRKASAWEALTQGRCNNTEPLTVKVKAPTIRQLKDQAMRKEHERKAAKKFEIASHSPKESKRMSDDWRNRKSTNVTGFWDKKEASVCR